MQCDTQLLLTFTTTQKHLADVSHGQALAFEIGLISERTAVEYIEITPTTPPNQNNMSKESSKHRESMFHVVQNTYMGNVNINAHTHVAR